MGGRLAKMKSFLLSHTSSLCVAAVAAVLLSAGTTPALAAHKISFKGKTVTVLVGSHTGGSTDLSARLMAPFLSKYLPGKPSTVVQNMPGAHDLIAMNYFARQVKPNGHEVIVGSSSQFDPLNYRVPQSRYDPTTFNMVGGVNIGGTFLIVRNDALARFRKKGTKPLAMGTVSGYPHVGMLMTAWGIKYLGWNARWVPGYGNNSDLSVALERGEIDMTSLAAAWLRQAPVLANKAKFTIVYQTGADGGKYPSKMPELAGVPMFPKAMKGKLSDSLAREAYQYWRNLSYVFKWMALPPKTPKAVVAVYQKAFRKVMADPEFIDRGQKLSPGFSLLPAKDLTESVDALSKVPHKALVFMTNILREQGLKVEMTRKHHHHHHRKH